MRIALVATVCLCIVYRAKALPVMPDLPPASATSKTFMNGGLRTDSRDPILTDVMQPTTQSFQKPDIFDDAFFESVFPSQDSNNQNPHLVDANQLVQQLVSQNSGIDGSQLPETPADFELWINNLLASGDPLYLQNTPHPITTGNGNQPTALPIPPSNQPTINNIPSIKNNPARSIPIPAAKNKASKNMASSAPIIQTQPIAIPQSNHNYPLSPHSMPAHSPSTSFTPPNQPFSPPNMITVPNQMYHLPDIDINDPSTYFLSLGKNQMGLNSMLQQYIQEFQREIALIESHIQQHLIELDKLKGSLHNSRTGLEKMSIQQTYLNMMSNGSPFMNPPHWKLMFTMPERVRITNKLKDIMFNFYLKQYATKNAMFDFHLKQYSQQGAQLDTSFIDHELIGRSMALERRIFEYAQTREQYADLMQKQFILLVEWSQHSNDGKVPLIPLP